LRVLWFTNIELPAVRHRLGGPRISGGGWMEGLRAGLCREGSVELAVAAAGPLPFDPFEDEGVLYYHLDATPASSGVRGVVAHWRHRSMEVPLLDQARAIVRRFDPALVHVHGSERPFGLLAGDPPPVLLSLQGMLSACAYAYFRGIPASDIARDVFSSEFLKGRGLVHDGWTMHVGAARERRILRQRRYFVGRTGWDRGLVQSVNPEAHYYHIDEILRPQFYDAQWATQAAGPFVVYTTGGTDPYKGLIVLLEAVAMVRDAVRPAVRLRVAGDLTTSEIWPIALRAVRRLRLDDVVEWLGPLDGREIVSQLMTASVYVHPSFVDNSPNALAEAMMLGVPCVASAAGGIPWMIDDGREGVLFQPGDVSALAASLEVIAADPATAAALGVAARRRASARHDPARIVADTLAAYRDVTARHKAGDR
jgi:glycosyltransferase involved in cell wall biosynthesis